MNFVIPDLQETVAFRYFCDTLLLLHTVNTYLTHIAKSRIRF
jgi:hypothetical protein